MITYAQNFEDVMLWRALGHIESGFYVDIGAQDPVADSVSLAFYERGWRGVHVEPIPTYAQALREARPDETVVQAAIGEEGPIVSIFGIPNTGLSTAKNDIAQAHEAAGFPSQRLEVACIRLAALLDRWSDRDVHWLKIDVEGMEGSVLRSWAPSSVRPWIVLLEATVPRSQEPSFAEWEPVILGLGYKFAYFDGLNRFYVSKAHRELLSAFAAPPNVFDGFALSGTACNGFSDRLKELVTSERAEINRLTAHQAELVEQLGLARKDAEHTVQAVRELQKSKEELQLVQREMRAREEAHTELQTAISEETRKLGLRLEKRDVQITQVRADLTTTHVDLAKARAEREMAQTECDRMRAELTAERAQWLRRMDEQERLLREAGENARLERTELERKAADHEAQVFDQLSSTLRLLEERANESAKERADLQLTHARQQALLVEAHAEQILQLNAQLRTAQETMALFQAQVGAEKKERADLSKTHARQQALLAEAHAEQIFQLNAQLRIAQEAMALLQGQVEAEKRERADLQLTHARQQALLVEAHAEQVLQLNAQLRTAQEAMALLQAQVEAEKKERSDLSQTHARQQALLAKAHAEQMLQVNAQLRTVQEAMTLLQAQVEVEKKERVDLLQAHVRQQAILSEAHEERERQLNARFQALQETAIRDRESARQLEQSAAAELLRIQQESASHASSMAAKHAIALQAAEREYADAMRDQLGAAATIEIELREQIAGEKIRSEQLRNTLERGSRELEDLRSHWTGRLHASLRRARKHHGHKSVAHRELDANRTLNDTSNLNTPDPIRPDTRNARDSDTFAAGVASEDGELPHQAPAISQGGEPAIGLVGTSKEDAMLPKSESGLPITNLNELLDLFDEDFVRAAYLAVLGRPVDPDGLNNYLIQIRRGEPKEKIISELATSKEGRNRSHQMRGLPELIEKYQPRRELFIARLLNRMGAPTARAIEKVIRSTENRILVDSAESNLRLTAANVKNAELLSERLRKLEREIAIELRASAAEAIKLLDTVQSTAREALEELTRQRQELTVLQIWCTSQEGEINDSSSDPATKQLNMSNLLRTRRLIEGEKLKP
jgi:FkbM family methyltransferase